MADDVADQLYQLTVQINRLVKIFGGGGQSPFSDPGTSKASPRGGLFANKDDGPRGSRLGTGVRLFHGAISKMHGGADELVYALTSASRGLAGVGIAATALVAAFEGAMKLSKTYSRLTDVGETFGGSMFNMAAEAGKAGLSLNQFAELQTRNSVVTAMMNDTLARGVDIQQENMRSTQSLSGAQTMVSRNLLEASAQIDRFAGSSVTAAAASSDLGSQHSDTGTTANRLNQVLAGATSSAADLTHQQIAMGNSMAQAQTQMAALAHTATPETGVLITTLGEAGRVAAEMVLKQKSMGETISQLNDRLSATSSITQSVSGSMSALLATQSKTTELTTNYNKQVAEAAMAATRYAANQGVAGDSSLRSREELDRRIQLASETFVKLSDQQKTVSDLTATVGRGLTDAAVTVMGPRAPQTAQVTTQASMLRLNSATGMVATNQLLLNDLMSQSTLQMTALTGSMSQQTDLTNRSGATFGMMGEVATSASKQLDAVANSSGDVAKANEIQARANTSITAQAQKDSKGTTQTLAQLQLQVRDDLTQFGFFGMALGEVTNATSDYMQTLLQGGQLNRMDGAARARAVEQMLGTVSELSMVWGTSREAIMKSTNTAMQQANYAASQIDTDQRRVEAGQQWISALAAIPGEMGPKLSEMFAEQVGKGGFINTSMGKGFISTGMGQLNDILVGRAQQAMNNNQPVTAKMQADAMGDAYNALRANRDRLEQLANDPELGPAATEQLKLLTSLNGKYTKEIIVNGQRQSVFDKEKYEASVKQAALEKGHQDVLTKNMLVFSSSIEKITGGFMDGFYSMIASMVGDADGDTFKATMQNLENIFRKLGSAAGGVIGILFSPTSLSILSVLFTVFESLTHVVSLVIDSFNWMINGIKSGFGALWDKLASWGLVTKEETKKDAQGHDMSRADILNERYQYLQQHQTEFERQKTSSDPAVAALATKNLKELEQIRTDANLKPGETRINAAAVQEKRDSAAKNSVGGVLTDVAISAVPAYLLYSHMLNRGAARAAKNTGGLADRMVSRLPMGKSRIGRKIAAGEKAAMEAASGLGGGCCDSIANGLSGLGDKIDFHGTKADKNAAKIAEAAVESGEKGAAHVAQSAAKGGAAIAEAGAATGSRMGAVWSAIKSPFASAGRGISSGLGAFKSGAGNMLSTMRGTLKTAGEGLVGLTSKGVGKSIMKLIPGIGLAMGGIFSIQRAWQGDFLGAAGELAGGVASLVPGVGTAVDLAIQGGLLARDIYNANKEASEDQKKKEAEPTPIDPFADTGARVKDDPGINQSPAEANMSRLETMSEQLASKVEADKKAGDTQAATVDQATLEKLQDILVVLHANHKDQKENNDATQLIQSLWPLQVGS